MALKRFKPNTNAQRNTVLLDLTNYLTTKNPEKSLLKTKKKHSGRNNQGKITIRHRGGGSRRKYRVIDFKRNKDNIYGRIATLEYDPNRTCNICLVNYEDGEKRYVLATSESHIGQKIISGDNVPIKNGNCLTLENIIEGTFVHNIEMSPGKGAQLCRSAGTSAQVLGKDEASKYVIVRLSSGETRKILAKCRATVGVVGNSEHNLVKLGKAGRNRWKGIRPTVRGSVMNPNDHPHGGGEGKSPIGRAAPLTPWGKKALGVKTRNNKKQSTKLIIRRRKSK